jgi:hypothetical protein
MKSLHTEARLDAETSERLQEQSGLLLRIYQADFAKDPTSPATESSRSNMIALRHSINQIYGQAAGLEVAKAANSLGSTTDDFRTDELAG